MSVGWRRGRFRETQEVWQPDYISSVSKVGSAELKRIARLWVGTAAYKANKDGCTEAIRAALGDPERVRAFVAQLSEFERAALGVLKARGGSAAPSDFASEVAALGLEARPSGRSVWQESGGPYDLVNQLLEKGLILAVSPSSAWDRPMLRINPMYYGTPEIVFADRRLLAAVTAVPPRPLKLASLPAAGASWARRPGEVMLKLLSVVEAVRRLGDLPATAKGQPSAASVKRLAKALGWNGRHESAEGTLGVRDPTPFYVGLLQGSGLLVFDSIERRLALSPDASARLERPDREQARTWVKAYRGLTGRFEDHDGQIPERDDSDESNLGAVRGMLLQGLASLPNPPSAWFRCEAFSEALFERAGERVSLGYLPRFHPPFDCKGPAEVQKKRTEWREELRRRWRRLEGPWITDALRGPLYELGLVEVAHAPGHEKGPPTCFRLTDLGRLAVDQVQSDQHATRKGSRGAEAPGQCLIVQPNFEVVVYLDRAAPRLLAFLERAGERGSASGATATYRLTRGSIYAALEAGAGIGALLKTLGEAAEHGLPPNVEATLRDWAARRDRLVVRRAARLLEFPDAAIRDAAALSRGRGTPLGERYLLLEPSVSRRAALAAAVRSIDYGADPVRCLSVTEDGAVTLDASRADLLVRTEVARWAEPEDRGDGALWRITRGSVERATRAGNGAEEILANISARAIHALPPLLTAAIRAWGGARYTAALASAMLLHVPDRETFYAIATSPTLRRHFEGFLGSQTLVVNPGAREVLWRVLGELGLLLETDLRPAQMPAVFEPRPYTEGGSTTISQSPVADLPLRPRNGGGGAAKERAGIALTPPEDLELREEVIRAAGQDMKLLLMGLPGAVDLAIGARRRRGRPRLRL